MGIRSIVRRIVRRIFRRKPKVEKVTVTTTPAKTLAPVRSIDIRTPSGGGGAVTIRGGGGGSGGGSTQIVGDIPKEVAASVATRATGTTITPSQVTTPSRVSSEVGFQRVDAPSVVTAYQPRKPGEFVSRSSFGAWTIAKSVGASFLGDLGIIKQRDSLLVGTGQPEFEKAGTATLVETRYPRGGTAPTTSTGEFAKLDRFKEITGTKQEVAEKVAIEAGVPFDIIGLPVGAAAERVGSRTSKELLPEFQARVDKGEELEVVQKEFETTFQEKFTRDFGTVQRGRGLSRSFGDIHAETGVKLERGIKTGLTAATVLGLGFGGMAGSAALLGLSTTALSRGEERIGGTLLLGGFATGLSELSPLFGEYSGLSKRNIRQLAMDVQKQPQKFLGDPIVTQKGGVTTFDIAGIRTAKGTTSADITTRTLLRTKSLGKDQFGLMGTETSKLRVFDILSGKTVRATTKSAFGSLEPFTTTPAELSGLIGGKGQLARGTVFQQTKEGLTIFPSASIGKTVKEGTAVIGLKPGASGIIVKGVPGQVSRSFGIEYMGTGAEVSVVPKGGASIVIGKMPLKDLALSVDDISSYGLIRSGVKVSDDVGTTFVKQVFRGKSKPLTGKAIQEIFGGTTMITPPGQVATARDIVGQLAPPTVKVARDIIAPSIVTGFAVAPTIVTGIPVPPTTTSQRTISSPSLIGQESDVLIRRSMILKPTEGFAQPRGRARGGFTQVFAPSLSEGLISGISPAQSVGLLQPQKQSGKLRTPQLLEQPTIIPPVTETGFGKGLTGFGRGFGFPFALPFGQDLPRPKTRRVKKQPKRRQASLAAIALDIRSPKMAEFETTGLVLRPIIKGKRKRKK